MAYRLQKLSLGGILDQAMEVVRENLGVLFTILLFFMIPFSIVQAYYPLFMMPQLPDTLTAEEIARIRAAQFQNPTMLITLGILTAIGGIGGAVSNAAIVYAIAERYLGRKVTAGAAFGHGLRRFLPLMWTSLLMGLAIMGGFILLIVPGILFALWFSLGQHVVILEHKRGVSALSRSKKLVRSSFGTLVLIGLILGALSLLVGAGSNFIPAIHVRAALMILFNLALTLYFAAVLVVYYFSCRCAIDNFDLEQLASDLDQENSRSLEPAV